MPHSQLIFNLSLIFFRPCWLKHTWKIMLFDRILSIQMKNISNTYVIFVYTLCTRIETIRLFFFVLKWWKLIKIKWNNTLIFWYYCCCFSLARRLRAFQAISVNDKVTSENKKRDGTAILHSIHSFDLFNTCSFGSFNKRFGIFYQWYCWMCLCVLCSIHGKLLFIHLFYWIFDECCSVSLQCFIANTKKYIVVWIH